MIVEKNCKNRNLPVVPSGQPHDWRITFAGRGAAGIGDIRRLSKILKYAWREHGLKAVSIESPRALISQRHRAAQPVGTARKQAGNMSSDSPATRHSAFNEAAKSSDSMKTGVLRKTV